MTNKQLKTILVLILVLISVYLLMAHNIAVDNLWLILFDMLIVIIGVILL